MPEAWTERDSLAFVDGDRNGCSQEALAASEAECGVLGKQLELAQSRIRQLEAAKAAAAEERVAMERSLHEARARWAGLESELGDSRRMLAAAEEAKASLQARVTAGEAESSRAAAQAAEALVARDGEISFLRPEVARLSAALAEAATKVAAGESSSALVPIRSHSGNEFNLPAAVLGGLYTPTAPFAFRVRFESRLSWVQWQAPYGGGKDWRDRDLDCRHRQT